MLSKSKVRFGHAEAFWESPSALSWGKDVPGGRAQFERRWEGGGTPRTNHLPFREAAQASQQSWVGSGSSDRTPSGLKSACIPDICIHLTTEQKQQLLKGQELGAFP